MVTHYKADSVNRFFRVSAAVLTGADVSSLDGLGISMSTWRHPQPHPWKHKCWHYTRHWVLKDPAQPLHLLDLKIIKWRVLDALRISFLCLKAMRHCSETIYLLLKNNYNETLLAVWAQELNWWIYFAILLTERQKAEAASRKHGATNVKHFWEQDNRLWGSFSVLL